MQKLIRYAIENRCSDIHITQNRFGIVRKRGDILPLNQFGEMTYEMIDEFIRQYIPHIPNYNEILNRKQDIDTSCTFEGIRLRANIFMSEKGINMALRILSDTIPTIEDLRLPQEIHKFTDMMSGLVLVIGITGSGKSTTMAAILNEINQKKAVNILTNEDPIEFIYTEQKAHIIQREVGTHIQSFELGSRSAMRQDPDVILIGEMRDYQTMSTALALAETGHLVFGTLHAKSVAETADRIVDAFPTEGQEQARIQLASVLRGVVHQQLVQDTKNSRIPLIELMMVNDVLSSMIKQKQRPNALRDYIRSKKDNGCIHLVDNIAGHIRDGNVDFETVKNLLSGDDFNLLNSILTSNGKRGLLGGH